MAAAAGTQPGYVRLSTLGVVITLFALPCITGRLMTYILLLLALVAVATPSFRAAFAPRSRNPLELKL